MTSQCPDLDALNDNPDHLRSCRACAAIVAMMSRPPVRQPEGCEDTHLLLAVLVTGELKPDDERRFYAHVAECGRCEALMTDCLLEGPELELQAQTQWQSAAEHVEDTAPPPRHSWWQVGALALLAAAAALYVYTNYSGEPAADTEIPKSAQEEHAPPANEALVMQPLEEAAITSAPSDELEHVAQPEAPISQPPAPILPESDEAIGASRPRRPKDDKSAQQTMAHPHPNPDSEAASEPCQGQQKLTRGDITEGIAKARDQIRQCGDRFPDSRGVYKVRMKISDGRVTEASSKPDDALAQCMLREIRQAHFPRACEAMTVTYPFVFR